mmetsp:Transcript_21476/g.24942  ORF Transcript_21476/g.24942 Transcript_21476/m.24942 type:complete len:147 (+) Transcript_21476:56-496(+)
MLSTKSLDPRSVETAEKDSTANALGEERLENAGDELSFYLEEPDSPALRPVDLADELAPFCLDSDDSEAESEEQTEIITISSQRATNNSESQRGQSPQPQKPSLMNPSSRKMRLIKDFIESELQFKNNNQNNKSPSQSEGAGEDRS